MAFAAVARRHNGASEAPRQAIILKMYNGGDGATASKGCGPVLNDSMRKPVLEAL
jgi:hypothetical protein